jgi:hypothetical protein
MIRPIAVLFLGAALAFSQHHQEQVNEHGDHVMRFSHKKAIHHFELHYDSGTIDVRANGVNDTDSRDQIGVTSNTSRECSRQAISTLPCSFTEQRFQERRS